ncbi:MAG TPA: ferrous iron transport protein B, partial [Magnetospirillaceae bacterium]|nr:ferrous iron transport protein B [Magnetospirillaceae bacterium]
YLCLQFQEFGIPVVGALNMSDEAEARGIEVDAAGLGKLLGIPMVKTVGPKGTGIEALLDAVAALADRDDRQIRVPSYGPELEERIEALAGLLAADTKSPAAFPPRWIAVKLLEKDDLARNLASAHPRGSEIDLAVLEAVRWIEQHFGKDAEIVVSEQRYGYIRGAVRETVRVAKKPDFSLTEALDRVIMHPALALPIFAAVLWSVFHLTFLAGEYPMTWLESLFGWLSDSAEAVLPEGFPRWIVVDGILPGVGGVLSFVPLIVLLFIQLSILEDVGYMARAAFATDKLLHSFGLHGQSVFPMMLGFGCSVPAILAARTLKSPRDRVATVLAIPFLSCGAKLPVYVLLAGAFFPDNAANMVFLVYGIGVVLSLLSSFVLHRTVLRGEPTPFVLELPPYRAPTLRGVAWHVWDKIWQYVRKAGTVILAASILVWAITNFPVREPAPGEAEALAARFSNERPDANPDEAGIWVETALAREALEHSAAGRIGKVIEPIFLPLGFDWRVGVATVTGFAAKEVVVSTLGILYRVGPEEGEESASLLAALRADPYFTPLTAFVLMLFTLIIPPCFAALATLRAELGWKWLGFAAAYLLALGWGLGFLVFRAGSLAGFA